MLNAVLPTDAAEQFEWFHALAQSIDDGAVDTGSVAALTLSVAEFVANQVPGHEFAPASADAAFVDAVRTLRENERAWNERLTKAVIDAAEWALVGMSRAAASVLLEFADMCPWTFFCEIATKQARAYRPGGV